MTFEHFCMLQFVRLYYTPWRRFINRTRGYGM